MLPTKKFTFSKQSVLLFSAVILLTLGSCSVRPIVAPTIKLTGTINAPITNPSDIDISSNQHKPTSPLKQALQKLSVENINQSIFSALQLQGINTKDLEPPIRGMNALVLSRLVAAANGEGTLFDNQNNKILVVNSTGNVIAEAQVNKDGNFDLKLEENVANNEDVALVFAEVIAGKLICKQPLEIDPSPAEEQDLETDNRTLVVNFADLKRTTLSTQQSNTDSEVAIGAFGFNPENGNPDNIAAAQISPIANNQFNTDSNNDGVLDFLETCGNSETVNPHLQANFSWQMPPNKEEKILYQYGLAVAINKDAGITKTDFNAAASAGIGVNGNMNMLVRKPNESHKLALALMDEAYIATNRATFPLTPFFDVNAALDFQTPFKTVNQDNISQDFNLDTANNLVKGMAFVTGIVKDNAGNPVRDATVLGTLNNDKVLDFSIGITDSVGRYELFLPALSSNSFGKYTITAIATDGNVKSEFEFIDEAREFRIDVTLP